MQNVAVQIVRFIDGAFPGWVECELVDADGRLHVLRDKVPTFTIETLDAGSKYPKPGAIRCEVVERLQDDKGKEFVRICTERPDDIESTEGLCEFIVAASLVTTTLD